MVFAFPLRLLAASCDGYPEIDGVRNDVTEDGSFMLTPQDDCSGEIKCQDCETVHVFPDKMFQSYGPQHKSL